MPLLDVGYSVKMKKMFNISNQILVEMKGGNLNGKDKSSIK